MNPDPDTLDLTPADLCIRICSLTTRMMGFWENAHGWAPIEAANLLNRSMLNWQSSLSASLHNWLGTSSDGDLILAWANLGALVEGQLKLFLSVYYEDYRADVNAIRDRNGNLQDPGGCTLEPLRQFFVKNIWTVGEDWNQYVEHIQQRRNAIHAFTARDIGSFDDWNVKLRRHLSFVREMNRRLPYPDSGYEPTEI